jgi:large subunit ribosomal protein L24
MKFHKGDEIIVTIGKDKGHKGKIEEVFPDDFTVRVAGINLYKRHMKRRDDKHPGGIIEKQRPISVGKIALLCPKCGKPTRIGYSVTAKDKYRICKKCEAKL